MEDDLPGMVDASAEQDAAGPAAASKFPAPFEQEVEIPDVLIATFEHMEVDDMGGDVFNDLGRRFPRDNSNRVADNEELVCRVNQYSYDLPGSAKCKAYIWAAATLGMYYYSKRRTIPAGYFGHYISMERHMLKPAGRHVLFSDEEYWVDNIPVDDESELIREIGTKVIMVVPENHVAGAFRVGGAALKEGEGEEEDEGDRGGDGDFVLIGQGRHVLESSRYRDIVITKLGADQNQVQLGPVTVLYIKEGFLGGAFERTTGTYQIFAPGPPYLLHEKDYEDISHVERKLDGFKLGPIHFITVKDGEMAGAYDKNKGTYQLLPPGNTYKLHEKDYECIEKKMRTDLFTLGPYTFITVQTGQLAGAYRQKGGEFQLLAQGHTYQLNENEYRNPTRVSRDQHVVTCGPMTFLTLQEGYLMGAYRTSDGIFEEFEYSRDGPSRFELHERDYHGLVVVKKYSRKVQQFGPNKIITIPESEWGVFEHEGCLSIKEAGFYKVDASYTINENIPLHVNSERFEETQFLSKDSVSMVVSVQVVWKITDPVATAKWPGSLAELRKEFRSKASSRFVMLMRAYSRAELLPTRQDVLLAAGNAATEAEDTETAVKVAQEKSKEIQADTETACLEMMNTASADGGWGIECVKVSIDSLELNDESIIKDMQAIAQTALATKRSQMEGRAALAKANMDREAAMNRAQAKAEVQQATAESEAKVKVAEARAASEISLMEATNSARAQAEAKKIELEMQLQLEESAAALEEAKATRAARAEAEAKKIELETQRQIAESQVSIEETKLRSQQMKAETEANSVKALAEAAYDRGRKEQEVASMMPPQEFELKKLELVVEGMRHFAAAAWRHPEDAERAHLHLFWEEMKPFVKVNPLTAVDMQGVQARAVNSHLAMQEKSQRQGEVQDC